MCPLVLEIIPQFVEVVRKEFMEFVKHIDDFRRSLASERCLRL